MNRETQPAFDFGLPDTMRARKEPWMAADARREAHAKQTARRKEVMWEKIVAYIRAHGDATADEITAAWHASPNSVAPRCCELLKLGRLVKTGAYRKTRYGCDAAVLAVRGAGA